jgi:hypothetical protein
MGEYVGRENRNDPRVQAAAPVFIKINGKMFAAQLKDLSVRSLRVASDLNLPLHTAVEVVIMHSARNAAISGEIERAGNGQLVITSSSKTSANLRALFNALKSA